MPRANARCILVLGTPRSGTSCAAGIVHQLGVPMAPEVDLPDGRRYRFGAANIANPKGFYTDGEFEGLGRWVYGTYFPAAPVAFTDAQDKYLQDLVAEREAHSLVWGVKEWRVALYLPRFVELAGNVKIIRMSRDPKRAADSWNEHFSTKLGPATEQGMITAKQLIDAAVAASGLPVLDLDFDAMIDAPEASVQQIAQFVNRPVNDKARAMIDLSLRRF